MKFSERPHLPKHGKKVTFRVYAENGIPITVEVNGTLLERQEQRMDILAEWEGVLSSTIASISADSEIQLENAEIQVLEKKASAENK